MVLCRPADHGLRIGEASSTEAAGVFICICEAVSSVTVRQVIADGARTVRQVAEACGASTDCGRCATHVRALLEERHGPRPRGRIGATA